MMDFGKRDIHILKYFSSFVSVSDGRVIFVSDPKINYCPLANHFYKELRYANADKEKLKKGIKEIIESKIEKFGFFTPKRAFNITGIQVPYGASEMLMFALREHVIDAAVVVCDGAGTVITDKGEVVQGIGARMNTLILTSPIKRTISRLKRLGCLLAFENASIDQFKGAEKAIKAGYRKIAITINGHDTDKLKEIRRLESSDAEIILLVTCTTGIFGAGIRQIGKYADLVWSCASLEIRKKIGAIALLQISKQIPVFALTHRGIDFVAAYAQNAAPLRALDERKQYIISQNPGPCRVGLGGMNNYLREDKLPVLSKRISHLAGARN